ncbi:MAG: glycosyltransferase family 39 protein [Acidobacteriota bacterium]
MLYLLGTSALAWSKLFWFDEILTYHIVRAPSIGAMWKILQTGLDLNPPLFFVVTHFIRSLLGEGELAMRLPALVGFWVMCLCLYRFVSRGCGPLYGLSALLLPIATNAYEYAFEARPYAMVLGLCAGALVCWQSYARDGSRIAPAILWVCMTAAVSCHYYALMALIPLGGGELVRLMTIRKWDFKVLLALAFSATPVLFFLPQLSMARTFAANFWAKPSLNSILTYYEFLIGPGQFFLVIALVLVALVSFAEPRGPTIASPRLRPTLAESMVAIGFVVLPYIDISFAMTAGSGFTPRYALPSIIGVAALIPMAAYASSRSRIMTGSALVAVFFMAFSLRELSASRRFLHGQEELKTYKLSSSVPPGLPLLVTDSLEFMKLAHYGSTEVKERSVYLVNLPGSAGNGEPDTVERLLILLRRITPMSVFDYSDFIRMHPRFLVLGYNWEVQYFVEHNAHIQVVGASGQDPVIEVAPK